MGGERKFMESGTPVKGKSTAATAERSFLEKVVRVFNSFLTPTSKVFIVIAGAVVTAMMFLTFFDVALRYVLNEPISGSLEITEYLMILLVIFSLGYTGMHKGHIRVDLILMYLPKRAVKIMDVFAYLISAIFYILICWRAVLNGMLVQKDQLTSAVLFIPVYPFAYIVIIGAGLLVLVFIKDTIDSIHEVIKVWSQ